MEKRFTTNKYYIYDHFKDDRWLVNEVEAEEIVEIMNNLDMKARERSKALSKLQKENEELKQELAIYRKVASCGNCKYHNYDWYDDGDEFEVCDKGNDVTDGICEDWEEL